SGSYWIINTLDITTFQFINWTMLFIFSVEIHSVEKARGLL
ncbi:hypothetical protein HMPREF0083_01981, partial [Aneurinibacillus aneurinilyticus ATCC 12856]